jgi:hypothetical protein
LKRVTRPNMSIKILNSRLFLRVFALCLEEK